MNKNISELMEIFCNDKKEKDIFFNYKRLDYYINQLINKKKSENEIEYIKKFQNEAKNFEESLKIICGRNEKY